MEYPIEKALEDGVLDEVGKYIAESGIIEMLKHGSAEVWVYRSGRTGRIKHTYNEDTAENCDDRRQGSVPRDCLNDDRTSITSISGKRRAIEFAMELGLPKDAAEYVVEWNYDESEINPAQPLYKPDTE